MMRAVGNIHASPRVQADQDCGMSLLVEMLLDMDRLLLEQDNILLEMNRFPGPPETPPLPPVQIRVSL